ncbi:hypothetical protein GB931_18365 [Modestobacter sp. I12A-02628]|uniref:Uncharacterized protein n=1 Tax=Goekera deserti TaxID=2497753 RepID=A0A7K3W7T3_9ACTN|nr:hypothetical protein [Goekera deserti]MPQ99845.1 hypothetical protein [Goekera deserti]NDI50002.1 hypothetical protein [Goekera deserti]NEL52521.1 hypothetical protein [Goekera deserti]
MRVRRAPVLSLAAVALVLLAGCSGQEEPASGGGTAAEERESPLTPYFDAVYGGDLSEEEQQARFEEQQREQEEIVAQCMQDEGFEYTPADNGSFSTSDGSEYRPEDRDWVEQYGYGAINSPFNEQPPPEEEYVDPNADYVMSLSESEQQAFNEALYGPPVPEDQMSEDGSYEYDWEASGCTGRAQHEVTGEDPSQSEEFRPLFDAINELYETAASSPDMTALDAEWAACMDAAGQPGFSVQADAQNSIYEEQSALYEDAGSGELGEAPPPQPGDAVFDALAEKEVELALVDLDCREETDYRDRAADVMFEIEEQFVADHQAELDALVAAAEQD